MEEVNNWLSQALDDLETAEDNLSMANFMFAPFSPSNQLKKDLRHFIS
jgi:HEPN domain-containing protein